MLNLDHSIKTISNGVLNSYAQIFFSLDKRFAILLLLASFVDPFAGLAGLISILITQLFAFVLGFDRGMIYNGLISFNSLLTGLGLGVYFEFNLAFFILLLFSAILCTLLTVWLSNLMARYNVPFLSLPFLLVTWAVLLSAREFQALGLSGRGIYTINEMYNLGGSALITLNQFVNDLGIPDSFQVYLKSLGAIFFSYNLLTGSLIAIGLLLFSRIAFILSLIGFYAGYSFYFFMEGDMTNLHYSYIGFNFILSAIAIGGFFLIPSTASFLFTLLLTPVIAIVNSAVIILFAQYQLPVYSLPFNMVVILALYTLNIRYFPKFLHLVGVQNYSPEVNLYKYLNFRSRFDKQRFVIGLPFFGEWKVSQAHDGEYTHKDDWKHAWDFVVTDETGLTYRQPGTDLSHYYAYKKPVLAVADGFVVDVNDQIDDNAVGKVDLKNNWGNSIVIKHTDGLYSQLSHLLKGSIKVKKGDAVKKGDRIAELGNSGRSPEPHIHFQIQTTPFVGSKTLEYPISYFMKKREQQYDFCAFEIPEEGDTICNVETAGLLRAAFDFVPGKVLRFQCDLGGTKIETEIDVLVDMYSKAYLYCREDGATAHFEHDGTLFYFTGFSGSKKSPLYTIYWSLYKVLLGYYTQVKLDDHLPLTDVFGGTRLIAQDFIAPFYQYLKAPFQLSYESIDSNFNPKKIVMRSAVRAKSSVRSAEITIENQRIERIEANVDGTKYLLQCID